MAGVRNPVLSLDATGKLARAVCYTHWKAIKVAKALPSPNTTPTPAQAAQRARLGKAAHAWKYYVKNPTTLNSWRRQCQIEHSRIGPGPRAIGDITRAFAQYPRPAYATSVGPKINMSYCVYYVDCSTGGTPNPTSPIDIWEGLDPHNLSWTSELGQNGGEMHVESAFAYPQYIWMQGLWGNLNTTGTLYFQVPEIFPPAIMNWPVGDPPIPNCWDMFSAGAYYNGKPEFFGAGTAYRVYWDTGHWYIGLSDHPTTANCWRSDAGDLLDEYRALAPAQNDMLMMT